jgi:hypothetical protein
LIHPAAIKNYLADVATMREALDDHQAAERPELIAPLRRLIHSVVVHAEPGVKGFEVEIKGRLQELLGAPFLTHPMGGGLVVAREEFEPPTPGDSRAPKIESFPLGSLQAPGAYLGLARRALPTSVTLIYAVNEKSTRHKK